MQQADENAGNETTYKSAKSMAYGVTPNGANGQLSELLGGVGGGVGGDNGGGGRGGGTGQCGIMDDYRQLNPNDSMMNAQMKGKLWFYFSYSTTL